jgi:hypothetical protein
LEEGSRKRTQRSQRGKNRNNAKAQRREEFLRKPGGKEARIKDSKAHPKDCAFPVSVDNEGEAGEA